MDRTDGRTKKVVTALAIAGVAAALGFVTPRTSFAKDDALKWRCTATENQCLIGSKTICQVGCDAQGCACDAWDPAEQ